MSGNCISAAVCEHLDVKVPYASTSDRERNLKDIPLPIYVFRVDWRQDVSLDAKVGVSPELMARRGADQLS